MCWCVRNLSKRIKYDLSFLPVVEDLYKPIDSAKPTTFVDSNTPITTKEAITNENQQSWKKHMLHSL